jgi:hypothetical protein
MFRILLKKYMIESLLLFGALAIVLFFSLGFAFGLSANSSYQALRR